MFSPGESLTHVNALSNSRPKSSLYFVEDGTAKGRPQTEISETRTRLWLLGCPKPSRRGAEAGGVGFGAPQFARFGHGRSGWVCGGGGLLAGKPFLGLL